MEGEWRTAWHNIFKALGVLFGFIILSLWVEVEYWQHRHWIVDDVVYGKPLHRCPFFSWSSLESYLTGLTFQGLFIMGLYVYIKTERDKG